MTDDFEKLRDWVGNTEQTTDTLVASPLVRASATLDRSDPPPADGDQVPPGWHWFYFLPSPPPSPHRRGSFPCAR